MIGISSAGGGLELEAAIGALAGERRPQEVDRLARSVVSGCSNGIPFQPSTIRSEEAPMPSAKRPPEASASAAACLASSARPRVQHADHAGPEPRLLGPLAAERERREAVGPVRLARPDVGVAGGLGALHALAARPRAASSAAAASGPSGWHMAATLSTAACARSPAGKSNRVAPMDFSKLSRSELVGVIAGADPRRQPVPGVVLARTTDVDRATSDADWVCGVGDNSCTGFEHLPDPVAGC